MVDEFEDFGDSPAALNEAQSCDRVADLTDVAAADPLEVGSTIAGPNLDPTRSAAGGPEQSRTFVYESRGKSLYFGSPTTLSTGQIEHFIQS